MLCFTFTGVNGPTVTIAINDGVVFSDTINGSRCVGLPFQLKNNDTVVIAGIGKRNGEDGIWDTKVDDQGNIISDKYLVIDSIEIDNIAMGMQWINSINSIGKFESNFVYYNGQLSFTVRGNLLDWIIEEKFVKHAYNPDGMGSYDGDGRFDYDSIRNKINSIKKLLDD